MPKRFLYKAPRLRAVLPIAALLVLESAGPSAFAQTGLRFERLSLEQGVAHDLVYAIHQDRRGFMWFGTMYGLMKYDGRRYTAFKHEPSDSNSISFNDIIAIHEDRAGHLWIGTWGGGLNRFDPVAEKFTRFLHDSGDTSSVRSNIAWAISEDHSGNIWIGTQAGLDKLSFEQVRQPVAHANFMHYRLSVTNPKPAADRAIRALLVDVEGRIWIGASQSGLFCITSKNGKEQMQSYRHEANNFASISADEITSLYQDQSGQLWIGTAHGLNRMNLNEARGEIVFQRYHHDTQNSFSLSHNRVGPIAEDHERRLWVGTAHGLNRFDRATETFTRFQHDPADPYSLRTNTVVALCSDRSGVLWTGTYFGGVHKLDTRGSAFVHVRRQPENDQGLWGNGVQAFYQDHQGTLWVGTSGGGLHAASSFENKSNSARPAQNSSPPQKFERYRANRKNLQALHSNMINAITGDTLAHIWVGTQNGGLTQVDSKRKMVTYRHNPEDSTSLSSDNVLSLHYDRAGDLWIGTDNGLNKLEHGHRRFVRYRYLADQKQGPGENFVHTISEDRAGMLWLGTYRGLLRFDRRAPSFKHYRHETRDPRSLSNDYVYAIHEDRTGRLWVGTSDGLNYFDRAQQVFFSFKEKDGLPNGVICGIIEDETGRLWLSTYKGLSCFDPRTRAFKNYDAAEGLQSNMFGPGASYKNREGVMYFGGPNGYNYFDPEKIQANEYPPPVELTAVKIFDQVLAARQYAAAPLRLSHEQNFLSFEFAALSFAQPEKNQYAYQLAGVDQGWIQAGTKNFANYTKLPPGHYVFRVKGANQDGVWNEQAATLAIVITPPWWRTWAFYGLVSIAMLAAAWFWHRQRLRRASKRIAEIESIKSAEKIKRFQEVEQARQEERERVRKKIAADFHDESGHKLTKISLFCGVLQTKLRPGAAEINEYLERIMKAAAGLHKDLSDFIWALDPAENTLRDTALNLKEFGDKLFDHTGIRFDMHGLAPELEQTRLSMEMRQNLTCIFKEGMNNVLKHNRMTCQNVTLFIARINDHFILTLTDDGRGFNPNDCPAGHGLRNMQERALALGGELEIFSAPGKGAKIQFKGALQQSPAHAGKPPQFADWNNGAKLN